MTQQDFNLRALMSTLGQAESEKESAQASEAGRSSMQMDEIFQQNFARQKSVAGPGGLKDQSDGDSSDFDTLEDDVFSARRKAMASKTMAKKHDFPEPIFKDVINIGNVQTITLLDQVKKQLLLQPGEFIYWTSSERISVTIPNELYECKI